MSGLYSKKHKSSDDVVTICLFCKETESGFDQKIFETEREKCFLIKSQLEKAAADNGLKPPIVRISLLLAPNWNKDNNGYNSAEYLAKQANFIGTARKVFEPFVEVHDFYFSSGLTGEQQRYMHGLKALGSTIDMMKMQAVIQSEGRHLQLDSNTICANWTGLYKETFASDKGDAFNASFYDRDYVTLHSKIMYTTADSDFKAQLKKELQKYCLEHMDDRSDKEPQKNSIYKEVFSVVANEQGLSSCFVDPHDSWSFYPVNFANEDNLRLTPFIKTAINMSWAANRKDTVSVKDNPLVNVKMDDAVIDIAAYFYVVKLYTSCLTRHQKNDSEIDQKAYGHLLDLSNNQLDMRVVVDFFNANKLHAESLANMIPDNVQGNLMVKMLFNCKVADLKANPTKYQAMNPGEEQVKTLVEDIKSAHNAILRSLPLQLSIPHQRNPNG